LGGAHRDRQTALAALATAVADAFAGLTQHDPATLIANRRAKFLAMGSQSL
jgi:acetyl-CoA carboxylase carboxyl transferase subunit alpha